MKSNIRLKTLFLLLFVQPTGLDSVTTALLQKRGTLSANHHAVSTLRRAFRVCLTSRSCDKLKHINKIIQFVLELLLKCFCQSVHVRSFLIKTSLLIAICNNLQHMDRFSFFKQKGVLIFFFFFALSIYIDRFPCNAD